MQPDTLPIQDTSTTGHSTAEGETRRDFLVLAAQGMGAVGAASLLWPFISSMNPSKDVLALSSIEVDLSAIAPGQIIKAMWRGKPVFIRNRTPEEVNTAANTPMGDLPDPQTDAERVKKGKENWLVLVGVCTHLGCVPLGQSGEYNGWFCPCHGSSYDLSGRIRKGPAPKNLLVPEYTFVSDTKIKIG